MDEILLRSNRRAALVVTGVAALPLLIGSAVLVEGFRHGRGVVFAIGAALVLLGLWASYRTLTWLVPPRLALASPYLLVYLRGFFAWRVPLEAVECFFIGQAPSPVKVGHQPGRTEIVTVVVRLAERSKAWHARRVDPMLGKWSDGYITILGVWCEPLNGEVVNRLNHRLVAAKREMRKRSPSGAETR